MYICHAGLDPASSSSTSYNAPDLRVGGLNSLFAF